MDKVFSLILLNLAPAYKIKNLFGNIIPVLKSLNKVTWFQKPHVTPRFPHWDFPAGISNHLPNKICDENTYPFPVARLKFENVVSHTF